MAGLEQGLSNLSLVDLQFFKILLPGTGMLNKKLRLPPKCARVLGDRRELKLRLDSGGAMPLWDVELVSSGDDVYLGRGWRQFARTYDLKDGYLLVFRCDSAAVLAVTVFDPSGCRKNYPHAAAGAGSSSAGGSAPHINEPSFFTVTLRECNLATKQNQYLNVPMEFHKAHGYAQRRQVVLRMNGRSWAVRLKLNRRESGDRVSFKYGWHQFCVDNGLEVGDTCFFRVIRDCNRGEDDEEEDDDEHVLKVEVRKVDGTNIA